MKILHTSDWHIGKPFNGINDDEKRFRLRHERINAIERICEIADKESVNFVVVAGDLFDSPTPSKQNVSAALSAISQFKMPVYIIPGNHDFGGPASLWEQDFFLREKTAIAPNLHVLLEPVPVDTGEAIIFPCPLLRRHEMSDLTAWLRNGIEDITIGDDRIDPSKPRIILAHGTVQGFGGISTDDEESELSELANYINLNNLPENEFDYVALGDWHGKKQINSRAWYSGTHELDRFPKGTDNHPGHVLVAEVSRAKTPSVKEFKTTGMSWHFLDSRVEGITDLEVLEQQIMQLCQNRVDKDLLHLTLKGYLGLEEWEKLETMIESLQARLIRLKFFQEISIRPSNEEIESLVNRTDDQLVSIVAIRLLERMKNTEKEIAEIAEIALRELYLKIKR